MKKYIKFIKNRLMYDAHAGTIRTGIVGVGGWGETNANALVKTKKFNIAKVFDISTDKAQQFARNLKICCCTSYEQILTSKDIDAVVITVPNHYHFEMVKEALAAGKHVFIEKPLAAKKDDCLFLHELSNQQKVILYVGHQVRKEPALRVIKKIVDERTLGIPLYAHGIRTIIRHKKDWRKDPISCPGGNMEQLGIHYLDLMIYLFGKPISWSGWGRNIPYVLDEVDWGHVEMVFPNHIAGIVDSSFSSPSRSEFNLFCENGQIRYDGKKLYICRGNNWKKVETHGLPGSIAQFIEFAECIRDKKSPETDALNSAILAEIISSIRTGQ